MATSNPGASFIAEPCRPNERESQDLQRKSYIDALLENPPETANERPNGASSPNGVNRTVGASQNDRTKVSTTSSGHGASILQIIGTEDATAKSSSNTEANGSYTGGAEQAGQEKRLDVERQESKHEYSAKVSIK
jgi:hypothetical protein